MKKILFSVVLCLLFAGCKQERLSGVFCDNHYVFEQFEDSTELKGELFLSVDSMFGISDMIFVGDYIVANFVNRDIFFSVYDRNRNHLLDFGQKGRANNEFYVAFLTGQSEGMKFVVNDAVSCAMKIVDLEKTLKEGKCVVDRIIPTGSRVLNSFYIDSTNIVYEQEIRGNFRIKVMDYQADTLKKKLDLYEPVEDAFQEYYSDIKISPDRKKLVFGMLRMNQINFLSLETFERKSVSMYRNAVRQNKLENEAWLYYGRPTADDQYVYLVYWDQSTEDSNEVPNPMEIHVFDWDGNPVKKLKVQEYIDRVFIDSAPGYLYGYDTEDNIYRYKL